MFGWARTPVTRLRPVEGTEDQYGEVIAGELERAELSPCLFAPVPTALVVDAGVASTSTQPTAYWPDEQPDVRAGEIEGEQWRVDGRPQRWPLGLAVTLVGEEHQHGQVHSESP
jgi:hypothetical protein